MEVFCFMTEQELPVCCPSGHWIIRDPVNRVRELRRRGYSSLAKCAVCSTCGTVKYIDPGAPDEEFLRRKKIRQQRRNGQYKNQQDETVASPETGDGEN